MSIGEGTSAICKTNSMSLRWWTCMAWMAWEAFGKSVARRGSSVQPGTAKYWPESLRLRNRFIAPLHNRLRMIRKGGQAVLTSSLHKAGSFLRVEAVNRHALDPGPPEHILAAWLIESARGGSDTWWPTRYAAGCRNRAQC
jgi:hypothetical protein